MKAAPCGMAVAGEGERFQAIEIFFWPPVYAIWDSERKVYSRRYHRMYGFDSRQRAIDLVNQWNGASH